MLTRRRTTAAAAGRIKVSHKRQILSCYTQQQQQGEGKKRSFFIRSSNVLKRGEGRPHQKTDSV